MGKIYVFKSIAGSHSFVFDGSMLSEEEKAQAIIFDELPTKEVIEGKTAILKFNDESDELYYEYVKITPRSNQELEELKARLQSTEEALLQLVLEGGGI